MPSIPSPPPILPPPIVDAPPAPYVPPAPSTPIEAGDPAPDADETAPTGSPPPGGLRPIVCPSGLAGALRPISVDEERILNDRKLARAGKQLSALLEACWVETTDPGPYAFGGGRVDWDQALKGDGFYALLQLRTATYGPLYEFSVQCQDPGCRRRIHWEIDLGDLPVQRLSEESRRRFMAGNRFDARLPIAGNAVVFKLETGADEQRAAQRDGDDARPFSSMLVARVLEVEGVAPKHRERFLRRLSFADADALLDAFDEADCGVDTTIEIECPKCGALQDVDLPFNKSFLLPGVGRSKRRRARHKSSRRSR